MNPRFPCDRYIHIVEAADAPALSVVWGTFGDDTTCPATFLDYFADRPHLLQIHLTNETCRRNSNQCFEGELFGDVTVPQFNRRLQNYDLPTYAQIDSRIRDILTFVEKSKNENTTLVLSLGLEDNYTLPAYLSLRAYALTLWPYFVSRNPVGGHAGSHVPGDILERHSRRSRFSSPLCIANEDGNNQSFSDSLAFIHRYAGCLGTFIWRAPAQGRGFKGDSLTRITPPRKRTFTISGKDIIEGRTLMALELD